MGKAISMDIRDLFRQYVDAGSSARAAGRIVMISPATAVRLGKKIKEGQSLVCHECLLLKVELY